MVLPDGRLGVALFALSVCLFLVVTAVYVVWSSPCA